MNIADDPINLCGKNCDKTIAEEELTKLRMAISRVMSRKSETTNSRSTALVETPRESPDIHWMPEGILERHLWKKNAEGHFNYIIYSTLIHSATKLLCSLDLVY